jgi:hypothetical protein
MLKKMQGNSLKKVSMSRIFEQWAKKYSVWFL